MSKTRLTGRVNRALSGWVAAESYEKPIIGWLERKGYSCFKDISIGGEFPDVLGLKGKEIAAIELKNSVIEVTKGIGQCLHYIQKANAAYIALPSEQIDFVSEYTRQTLKAAGIGLLSVDSAVKAVIEAKRAAKSNSLLIKELKSLKQKQEKPPKNGDEEAVRQRIIELLREHPEGLSILSVSKHIGMTRQTASRYVLALISEGIVKARKVGPAKLCYLRKWGRKDAKK
jgi:DNA-binding transcriptional ArsR family regulator